MRILITGGSGFIGTHTVDYFLAEGAEVLNLDVKPPLDARHAEWWQRVDILEPMALKSAFREFQPDAIIHLAARAECDETTTVEAGYRMNTEGTQNVLDAIRETQSVRRSIIISSQFVCGPAHPPQHDEDFYPVTVYGKSKVITEELTRAAALDCCWTLVRPTNIWGPWHQRYTQEFWRVAAKGWYLHPGGKPVMRCYGYVGNLVAHLGAILQADESRVHRQVFYLSDPAGDIYNWASAFCMGLRGQPARRVSRPLLRMMGLGGDVVSKFIGKPFLINSNRVRSMTSDYLVPGAIEHTLAVLGQSPHTLEDGVRLTLEWLRSQNLPSPDR